MPEPFCTMYEKCKFLSMGYISALTQASVFNMKQGCSSVMYINFIAQDTSNISIQSGMVWDGKLSAFLATDYMSFLQNPGTQG